MTRKLKNINDLRVRTVECSRCGKPTEVTVVNVPGQTGPVCVPCAAELNGVSPADGVAAILGL